MATGSVTPPPGFELEQPQNGGATPPPGFQLEGQQSTSGQTPQAAPPSDENLTPEQYQQMSPQDRQAFDARIRQNRSVADPITGFLKGAEDTASGVASLIHKIPIVGEKIIPSEGLTAMKKQAAPTNPMETLGYGGETLTEFLLGDEALKGLSLAERLKQASGVAQIFEKSPRLMKAVQIGSEALRHGAVQTAQTLARTGDSGKALEEGTTMGATSAAMGGTLGVLGNALSKGGEAAKAVEEGSKLAQAAPEKVEVGQKVAGMIDDAKQTMHSDFDTGVKQVTKDIGEAKVPYQGSPLHDAAKEALQGKQEAKGVLGGQFNQIAGGSNETKNLLNSLSTDALDKEGKEIPGAVKGDLNIDELIQRRQQLTEKVRQLTKGATSSADRADLQIYGKLIGGIDDTIGQLARESGNPAAAQDYEALRGAYKAKVNLFKEPVVKALEAGDLDNASKTFLSGGKVLDKVNTLQNVLGPDGLHSFGQDIMGQIMKDSSSESGQINPAKFVKNWEKIKSLPDEATEKLFDKQAAGQGLDKLSSDLKTAANFQKLARLGIITAAPPLGLWGLTLGALAHGNFTSAAELLDKVANNPKAWAALKMGGKIAEVGKSPAGQIAGTVLKQQAGRGLSSVMQGASQPLSEPAPIGENQ